MAIRGNAVCIVCGVPLLGRQRAFCSRHRRNRHTNYHHQCYARQLERARRKKILLIQLMGSHCSRCGYGWNLAAMEFHHRDPATKVFQLDARTLANRNWAEIEREALKCDLLCSNCHAEVHNPDAFVVEPARAATG